MKSAKRFKIQQEKKSRKEKSMKSGKKSKSRYAIKHDAQKGGYYSDTSPLRFGSDAVE